MNIKVKLLLLVLIIIFFENTIAQERTNPKNQDEELGKVSWYRDYDIAIKASKKQNKPLLILFQEVPGCATCRNYGHNVLSHPLMTEAIENEFIPLAIFNNKGGKDREILKKYNEPTWNNPVVRIVNNEGDNIVKRVAGNYSARGLYTAMIAAIKNYGNEIPEYVKILGEEITVGDTHLEETYFKMYCFWTGEKELGAKEGVLSTKAGFMSGEVVKVTYDANKISEQELSQYAQARQMAPIKKAGNFNWSQKDEDYFIQHSSLKYLPLTEVQKTKINSALGHRVSPSKYLSPKQLKWFEKSSSKKGEILYNKDFVSSWNKISSSN